MRKWYLAFLVIVLSVAVFQGEKKVVAASFPNLESAVYASKKNGWNPETVYAHWQYETANFTSLAFRVDNNLAGITYVGQYGWKKGTCRGTNCREGGNYVHFTSFQDGVEGYIKTSLEKNFRVIGNTTDPYQQAQLLKKTVWGTDPTYYIGMKAKLDNNRKLGIVSQINAILKNSNPTIPTEPVKDVNKIGIITNASGLNVRSGPNTSSTRIGGVYKNDRVEIVQQIGDWYKIEFGNGYGYINNLGVQIISDSMPPVVKTGLITTPSGLNVRSGPGTNYARIGGVYVNNRVEIVEENGDWYKIKFGSGYGYINKLGVQVL